MTSNLATWNSDEKAESESKPESKKEEPKERRLPIPVFVDIEAILWDNAQQREFKYVFTLEIITDTEFVQKKRPWSFMSFFEKHQDNPDDKKTPQPGGPKTQMPGMPQFGMPQSMPGSPQTFNAPFRPSSGLQKQLEELFKTAHSLDKRMST